MVNGEISMLISCDVDIVNAREKGKSFAEMIGFRGSDLTLLSAVISELARTFVTLDCRGNVVMQSVQDGPRKGIAISASKHLADWYKDSGSKDILLKQELLPRASRLQLLASRNAADKFELKPDSHAGAVVRLVKWL